MTKMPFLEWLSRQIDRDDPIEDLARDAARDPKKPAFTSLAEWQHHVTYAVKEPGDALTALEGAWGEWLNPREGVTILIDRKNTLADRLSAAGLYAPPQPDAGITERPLLANSTTLRADMKRRFNNFKIEATAPDCTVYPITRNPQPSGSLFFDTVHFCYANHYALALSPEVLAYLINFAVAIEVKQSPEIYRDLLTTSPDKIKIVVEDDTLVLGGDSDWTPGVMQFEEALRGLIPGDLVDVMLPAFTTETLSSRVASLICVMDAASPYYNFGMRTMCGIPRIVLLGEAEDWLKLQGMAKSLAGKFPALNDYWEVLLPTVGKLAEEFVATEHDRDFWGQIYKHWGGSGTNAFGGWIANFVAWVARPDHSKPCAAGEVPTGYVRKARGREVEHGTTGSHISRVPFEWDYHNKLLPMTFAGGVLDVHVTPDLALQPRLSYAVLHAR